MADRRFLGEFLVASPLVLLLGIAIQARTSSPEFEPYSYSADQHQAILAIRPFLCNAKSAVYSGDPEDLRISARQWIEAHEHGFISSFRRANYFDSARLGIKGEVSVAIDLLAYKLACAAKRECQLGDFSKALQDVDLALKTVSYLKFADLDTIGFFAMRERTCLGSITPWIGNMNSQHIAQLEKIVARIDLSEEKIYLGAAAADRHYAIDGLRWNEARSRILDHFARSHEISNSGRSKIGNSTIASLSRPLFDQANSIRYSFASLESQRHSIAQLKYRIELISKATRHRITKSR